MREASHQNFHILRGLLVLAAEKSPHDVVYLDHLAEKWPNLPITPIISPSATGAEDKICITIMTTAAATSTSIVGSTTTFTEVHSEYPAEKGSTTIVTSHKTRISKTRTSILVY